MEAIARHAQQSDYPQLLQVGVRSCSVMSIIPGTRIGSFEILTLIGAGGMGEVYRARDMNLKRDVALKVLPQMFAGDLDRMARFKREAEVLASLNHPNI